MIWNIGMNIRLPWWSCIVHAMPLKCSVVTRGNIWQKICIYFLDFLVQVRVMVMMNRFLSKLIHFLHRSWYAATWLDLLKRPKGFCQYPGLALQKLIRILTSTRWNQTSEVVQMSKSKIFWTMTSSVCSWNLPDSIAWNLVVSIQPNV